MPDKIKNEIIDGLIEKLKEIKENGKDLQINVTSDMVNEVKLVDGTMFAQKEININIIYEQLYTKNENEILDTWKPYKKGDDK